MQCDLELLNNDEVTCEAATAQSVWIQLWQALIKEAHGMRDLQVLSEESASASGESMGAS